MAAEERVFLGLGSNLGDRQARLRDAVTRIGALPGTRVVAVSRFHETSAWGVEDQPPFVNAVLEARTALEPEELLASVKAIEREMGRTPTFRWGPREIDIDLLLFGDRVLNNAGTEESTEESSEESMGGSIGAGMGATLVLPHPRILERPFVWEPLGEIAPEVLEGLRRAAVSL